MAVDDIIRRIVELNAESRRLSGSEATMTESLVAAQRAVALSREEGVSPDYLCVSVAGEVYAMRQLGHHEGMLGKLDVALSAAACSPTFFGRARAYEEQALVYRLTMPTSDQKRNLLQASAIIEEAITGYEKAVAFPEGEIVSGDEITNRLLRCFGVAGAIYAELSDQVPDRREVYLTAAVDYAQREAHARVRLGHRGVPEVNAFHTLALVQGKLAAHTKGRKTYGESIAHFDAAKRLAEEGGLDAEYARNIVMDRTLVRFGFEGYTPEVADEFRVALELIPAMHAGNRDDYRAKVEPAAVALGLKDVFDRVYAPRIDT